MVPGPDDERPTGRSLEELEAGAGLKDDSKGGALKGGDQSHGVGWDEAGTEHSCFETFFFF